MHDTPKFSKKYDYLKKKRPHFLRLIIEILIDNSVYEIVIWKIWLIITSISPREEGRGLGVYFL